MTALPDGTQENWWESFYDDTFADVVMATGEDAATESAVHFILSKLHLQTGSTVFDQCCGLGRLSIPLARRGLDVIGVDAIGSYADRARRAAEAEGLPCEFHAGDAFAYVPRVACDGAFNWSSSFGYKEDDSDNRAMLCRAFEALKPGGRFALDYYSVPRLLREFQDRLHIQYQTLQGSNLVTRDAQLDFLGGMIRQSWTYADKGGDKRQKQSQTKMYMPHELQRLLLSAGFVDIQLYGGADGERFGIHSPRCVLTARKPSSAGSESDQF